MFHLELHHYALLLDAHHGVARSTSTAASTAVRQPDERAKSIGMSKGFTLFLAGAEVAGGIAVAIGFLPQLAAIGLIRSSARRHSKEDFRLEDRLLGRRRLRLERPFHVGYHAARDSRTRGGRFAYPSRRASRTDAITAASFSSARSAGLSRLGFGAMRITGKGVGANPKIATRRLRC